MILSLLFSEKQWNVREDLVLLPTFLFLKVLLVNTAWRRKKTGKFGSASPNMSLKLCTAGMWPWESISFFPSQATYSHLQKRMGRRKRLMLSLCPTRSSFISGHTEKIRSDLLVTASALEKGVYCGGWGEHHPAAATAQLTWVMRDIKLSEKSSAETLQGESNLCSWWCEFASRMTCRREKGNNGLVFSGLRALPCFCHNGSLNLPSQMGTGCGIFQSSSL